MSADRWERLNDVFHAALALDTARRPAFLAEACAGDEPLRLDVEQLIQAHERSEQFLGSPAVDALGSAERPDGDASPLGRRFGPYRVVSELGRGGMGSVFLAERDDGHFEQRVAIKIIKRGMDTALVLDRFRVERQILSSLDHPNIARLLDGGTTDEGLPYFVMELVDGVPIDRYADENRLSVSERLALFLQVCDAVSYAHRHLIVHRDIKPQNILVTAAGVPKLLDFGIAKVLQDAGDHGTMTIAGYQLLTPEYASPEQVDGRHTTTQTDVYSLGVVLYEVLTGRSPYRPRTWSPVDVCESVRSASVERPSTAVTRSADHEISPRRRASIGDRAAATDAGSLERLRVQLRGDLDAIVLSALRKEPERRYASVEQLSGDVRRHLQGLPVRARADSVWYRAAKFTRRNRVAVTAAGLVVLTLVAGTVATAWQARNARVQARLAQDAQARAERRFAEVRKLANTLLFDYHDAIKGLPGATAVRARLVQDALEYLNGLAAEGGSDRALRRELALAYRRVAEVQGGVTGGSLGDTAGAVESQRKSLAILEALLAEAPDDQRARWDVAEAAILLASLLAFTDDQSDALVYARRAQTLYDPLRSAARPTLDQRLALAQVYDTIGMLSLESGKAVDAIEIHRRQQRLLESAAADERRSPRLRRALSTAYQHLADAQGTFGDYPAALASIRSCVQLRTGLLTESPDNLEYKQLVGISYYWEADALAKLDRPREALAAYLRSLDIEEQLVKADPKGHTTGFVVVRIGNMLARLGDHRQAVGYFRRGQAAFADGAVADPANLWKRAGLVDVNGALCASLAALAQHASVAATCGETARLIEQTTVEPTNAVVRATLARSYTAMAGGLVRLATHPSSSPDQRLAYQRTARDMLQKSVAIWQDMSTLGMLTSSDDAEAATVVEALKEAEEGLRRLAVSQRAAAPPRP